MTQTPLRNLPSASASAQGASGPAVTLVCSPENGPLPEEALARLLGQMLPAVRIGKAAGPIEADSGGDPIVIALRDPVSALAWRLDQGSAPRAALGDWRADMEALLATHRRARQRITLIDAGFVTAPDPEGLALLAARLDARLDGTLANTLASPPAETTDGFPQLPAVLRLLAAQLLADPALETLRAELEAATLARPQTTEPLALVEASWAELAGLQDGLAPLTEALGEAAAGSAQETASPKPASRFDPARLLWALNRAAQKIGLLQEHMGLQQQAQQQAQEQSGRTTGEIQLLTAQSAALTRRLETARAQSAAREAVLAAQLLADGRQGGELEALRGEIDAMRASRSWRLTAPLRRRGGR